MEKWLLTGSCKGAKRDSSISSDAVETGRQTLGAHLNQPEKRQKTVIGSSQDEAASSSFKLKADKTGFVDVGTFSNKPMSDIEKYQVLTKPWIPNDLYSFPPGHRNLKFQKKWLSEFSWLAYSEENVGSFCKFCVIFAKNTEVGKGQHVRLGAFVNTPFIRWKDAKDEFRRHEQSSYHKNSCVSAQNFLNVFEGKCDDICCEIEKGRKQKAIENRQKILPVIKTVIFCGKQEIALRGHDDSGKINLNDFETNQGNFRALLKFRVDSGDSSLRSHLENCNANASYISPKVQNEIIDTCGEIILSKIVQKINGAKCFSILADETTDISGIEQFTLCARYTVKEGNGFTLKEDFLKFVPVHDTTGAALASKLLNELESMGICLTHLKGQGYDGAGAMSGRYKGCAAIIKASHPEALYVHCSSHALNLVLSHACDVQTVRNCIATMKEIISFFRLSPKRNAVLQEEIMKDNPGSKRTRLLKFCETRWSEHLSALMSFRELCLPILRALDLIQSVDDDPQVSGKAFTLSTALRNGKFLVSIVTISRVFYLSFGLSKYLQTKECDLSQAMRYANSLHQEIQEMRSQAESTFHEIFQEAKQIADEVGETIEVPRITARQTQRANYEANNPEDYFRCSIYIPFLDYFLKEMSDRFLNHRDVLEKLSVLLPEKLLKSDSKEIEACSKVLAEQWPTIITDPSQFKAERVMWKRMWGEKAQCNTPKDFLLSLDTCNDTIFPTLHLMLKVSATLPITTATAERSFSTLRRIKTYLRNSSSQNRVNGLAHLSIHKDINVSPEEVLDALSKKNRKLDFVL